MATTHIATTNLAVRTYDLGMLVTRKCLEENPESKRAFPLVVRGYDAHAEGSGVFHIISKDENSTSVTYKQRMTGNAFPLFLNTSSELAWDVLYSTSNSEFRMNRREGRAVNLEETTREYG
jgi:hypothetical protein